MMKSKVVSSQNFFVEFCAKLAISPAQTFLGQILGFVLFPNL